MRSAIRPAGKTQLEVEEGRDREDPGAVLAATGRRNSLSKRRRRTAAKE